MRKDLKAEKWDIVIQAGQSNAQGLGYGDVEEPWRPDDRVWYLLEDFTLTAAGETEQTGNFSLTFASDYIASGLLAEGRKLLILRIAQGGTGFTEGQWTRDGRLYRRMLELASAALEADPENRLVALLWHQGERDAKLHSTYRDHYRHLAALVNGTRSCFPGLPFVAGDLVQDWKQKHLQEAEPVMEAVRDVCLDCGGGFVSSEGLMSNAQSGCIHPQGLTDDDLHFCRRAQYELGHRYFAVFRGLTDRGRRENCGLEGRR